MLVIVALALTALLAFAGVAIDVGRMWAERRHVQTAADAAALAACRELINGRSDADASAAARAVAAVNLAGSPAGATATIADVPEYEDGHAGDPAYLRSGLLVAGTSVRVAISSGVDTLLAQVVGVDRLDTGARARCGLKGGPAVPIVARRYASPPGPGAGFIDHLATELTSTSGQVSSSNPRAYDVRTPASESVPGPVFAIYGDESKANNDPSFRGFIALDVRNFESTASRVYYNGITPGTNENTIKDVQGGYLIDGYPGPGFPPVSDPPGGATQVAVLSGLSNAFVVGRFEDQFAVDDRLLLGVYDGTVMEIPDFSISPPAAITLPSTTVLPVNGPSFTVSRNAAFNSTVTLHLHGDTNGTPADDIVATPPSNSPPGLGKMNNPAWSADTFVPDRRGTRVEMRQMSTTTVPPGIYTVWLEGHSGNPYFQKRRYPVAVRIGGAVRDFSLANSTLGGTTATLGGTISLPIYVSTTSASGTRWAGGAGLSTPVALTYDPASFTNCSYAPTTIGPGQITFSASAVTPSSSGSGAPSTLSVSTAGLAPGCYLFDIRAVGTNGDGQRVSHLAQVRLTVATTESSGQYVDIIGFAVFKVTAITANDIYGRAVSGLYADPNDPNLRRAQRARLIPWSS